MRVARAQAHAQMISDFRRFQFRKRQRAAFEAEAQRQSLEAAERAGDPTSDEYAVLREIEAELDRDDFAGEWKP
jgi:hypothetical protein